MNIPKREVSKINKPTREKIEKGRKRMQEEGKGMAVPGTNKQNFCISARNTKGHRPALNRPLCLSKIEESNKLRHKFASCRIKNKKTMLSTGNEINLSVTNAYPLF